MTDDVKPRRRYVSSRRRAQAADTAQAVAAAARALFVAKGWQGTTIAAVARRAGVSAETVYARFGSKAALLLAVIQNAARRGDPDTPLIEQAGPRAVTAATDARKALGMFARDVTEILTGAAELMAVARTAAETEPAMRETYERLQRGRRSNMAPVARMLAENGLREGVTEADALGTIWRLSSPELFLLTTRVEGLPAAVYAKWLEAALVRLLLPD